MEAEVSDDDEDDDGYARRVEVGNEFSECLSLEKTKN